MSTSLHIPALLMTLSVFFYSELSFHRLQALSFFFYMDDASFFMTFMTFFVVFCSFFFSPKSKEARLTLTLMLASCLGVFLSSRIIVVYFFYEASLFPILYIILKWGQYPERSLSSIMLLIYTAVFTLPFIFVILSIYSHFSSLTLPLILLNSLHSDSAFLLLITFLCFSVKLPIYGLHFWLPMAHVEAPTFGSILLAGVLLKLGGVGLLRVLPVFSPSPMFSYALSYFMVALLLATLTCCIQSDMKRLIAYSSVSHMMVLPPLLLFNTSSSISGAIMVMLVHGVVSPLLFMLVGFVYSRFSTRQLVFVRGFMLTRPLASLLCVLAFLFTLSTPPFPSFVAEMSFMFCAPLISYYFIPFLFLFCFLSLLYNLNWVSSTLFSSSSSRAFSPLPFSMALPIINSVLICAVLIPILSFVG